MFWKRKRSEPVKNPRRAILQIAQKVAEENGHEVHEINKGPGWTELQPTVNGSHGPTKEQVDAYAEALDWELGEAMPHNEFTVSTAKYKNTVLTTYYVDVQY